MIKSVLASGRVGSRRGFQGLKAWAAAVAALAAVAAAGQAAAQADFAAEMLRVHNAERSAVGVPALAWDQQLADEAREYGETLARTNGFTHDDAAENLWRGPVGTAPATIAQAWADEKKNWRNAEFQTGSPAAISKTGKWSDVGHYAQMVWRGTTRVGCATVPYPGGKDMVGICRYSPAGNYSGQWAYGPNSKPATIGSTLEDKVLKHFNGPRWSSGVPGLTWDAALAQQAQAALTPRLAAANPAGYQPPFGELIGESTYSGTPTPPAPSPRSLIVGWMNGGYRTAVIDPKNTRIGCATGAKVSGPNHRRILLCRLGQGG